MGFFIKDLFGFSMSQKKNIFTFFNQKILYENKDTKKE